MKVYKKLKTNFTVCSNNIHKHKLSLKAIGLYLYIINKPDEWDFSITGTASQVADGKDSVRSAISELEKARFIERNRVRKTDGTFGEGVWFVFDKPLDKPTSDNPTLVKPTSDNLPQVNTKERKKEKIVKVKSFTNQRDSVSPNLSVPKKNPSLASNLKAKAERKANKGAWKNGINKPFKTTTSTLKLGRTDGLAISLTDNVDVPALMVKHGLSEELVLECKEAYNNWIMGSSYDSKVWGKDMNIYVDRFCKQKVAKAKSKDNKKKDMFEEINDIYKAFD